MHYFNEILSHTKSKSNHQAPKFPLVLLYTFHQFLISLEESYTRTRLKVFILWLVFVEYSQCWLFNTIKYSTLHIKDFSSKCDQFRKKINLYRKHIFWSSWKSINTNISRIIDIFCRSSFGAWAFRLGLEICDVRRWYTGISQIAIQFFIKWNFSVKPFVYEHIQWLYQFSAPLFQKYV